MSASRIFATFMPKIITIGGIWWSSDKNNFAQFLRHITNCACYNSLVIKSLLSLAWVWLHTSQRVGASTRWESGRKWTRCRWTVYWQAAAVWNHKASRVLRLIWVAWMRSAACQAGSN